ncbi:MAG: NGG1p interacting factor NIF3 [Bacteriovoracaceae bacterium]|nr:NGG1p interacting factor NIF3 [Bacteriovoracaceae bacterium]
MLKLTFYVPLDYKDIVKDALFEVGAGKIGANDRCSFEVLGSGQFRPLIGANPSIGKIGSIEKIIEARVEMVFDDTIMEEVISVLKRSHPYETPAFDIMRCMDL